MHDFQMLSDREVTCFFIGAGLTVLLFILGEIFTILEDFDWDE